MIKIAQVGVGYWGPNLLRVFSAIPDVAVKYICDRNLKVLEKFKAKYTSAILTEDFDRVVGDNDIKAIVIATPAVTHFNLVKTALESGKDVFVEKPLSLKAKDAETLVKAANKNNRILMVGHLLEYHPAVVMLKNYIKSGDLGKVFYVNCNRLNLGKIRREENVLWSLAVHDIAAIMYLLGRFPNKVEVMGGCYLQKKVEDLAFVTLHFPGNTLAHINVSWLHPTKTRELTIVGSKKMAIFDDVDPRDKLKIINQYVEKHRFVNYEALPDLEFGSITIPKIEMKEPLEIECRHFIDCALNRKTPRSSGEDGLKVIKVLEAAQKSLETGKAIKIRR